MMVNIILVVIGSVFVGAASATVLDKEIKKGMGCGIVVK